MWWKRAMWPRQMQLNYLARIIVMDTEQDDKNSKMVES